MSDSPRRRWTTTTATELLGIDNPIVLGPFGGLSSAELTATVSNGGGLGSYGLYGYDAERILETGRAIRALTDKPFNLNLWVPLPDETPTVPDDATYARYLAALAPYFTAVGVAAPERPERYLPSVDEQFEAVLEVRPAVLSLVFGALPPEQIERAKEHGIRVIGTATTVDEAIALQMAGLDAIVASGSEAGGHRVSFLRPAEKSLIGTFALIPQVADAVSVPVIAAGGIADGRGVAAAITLGADAVQIGSAFLATQQSAAPQAHRDALHSDETRHTVLTRAMSGRLARGIPNRVVTELDGRDDLAPFPIQNWLTGKFRAAAAQQNRGELLSLWAGQGSPLIRMDDAAELLETLLRDAGALLDR